MATPRITENFVPVEEENIVTDFQPVNETGKKTGTITKAPPWWMREVVKPTMEYGGMALATAPLVAGAAIFPPSSPAAAIASVPVAGAGYAAGARGYRELERGLYGTQEPTEQPESIGRTAMEITRGAGYEALGQGAGAAVGGLVSKMATPEATAIGKAFEEKGVEYGLADLYPNSRMTSWIERLMEYYPGSTDVAFKHQLGRLQRLNEMMNEMRGKYATGENIGQIGNAIKAEAEDILKKHTLTKTAQMDVKIKGQVDAFNNSLNQMVNEINNAIGKTTRHEAGAKFGTIIQARKDKLDAIEQGRWQELDKVVGKDVVDDTPLQEVAQTMLNEQMALKAGERDKGLIARLKGYLPKQAEEAELQAVAGGGKMKFTKEQIEKDPILKAIAEEGVQEEVPMTWYGLDKTRSALLKRNREIHASTQRWDTPEQRVNEKLIEGINESLSQHAQSVGGEVWAMYGKARTLTKRIHDLFDKDMLKVMNSNPEEIVGKIIKGGDKGITLLRQIKAISGEEGLVPLREATWNQMVNSATKGEQFSTKALKSSMNKIGKEAIDELFLPAQKEFLDQLSKKTLVLPTVGKGGKGEVAKFLERISRKDDAGVVNLILQKGNDRYVHIAEKVFSPDRLKEIKAMALEQVLKRTGEGNILPVSSAKALDIGGPKGLDVPIKRLFRNDGTYEELKTFLEMGMNMKRVETLAANTSRTAGTWHFMNQIGKFATHPISSSLAIASQYTLAKMYFSPWARKRMIQAWRLPPESKAAIEAFSKASMIIANEENANQKEGKK